MKWVILPSIYSEEIIFGRVDEDEIIRVTCCAEHPEYLEWLEEGNTPEEWNPNGNQ